MRNQFLPYCLPWIGEEEIAEVIDSLSSGWVTTGPKTRRFEEEFERYVGARHAIAVSSCTAALHLSLKALGVGPGDEVIVPTLTFCATANVVVHLGATPVIVDVNEHGLMSPEHCAQFITPKTKVIVPVHYAGQSCDLDGFRRLGERHGIPILEDAAHAVGADYHGQKIGVHGAMVAFSFYATKNMTTGEGGMITTNDDALAASARRLALHGMSKDAWKRYAETGSWYYEVLEPGFKANMTDVQASLGLHQLRRLDGFIERRRELAHAYRRALEGVDGLILPEELPGRGHCYHLYPVQVAGLDINRGDFIEALKAARIGTSVHFIPLHRHPYYRQTFGLRPEQFPVAERLYQGMVSLPLYPKMTGNDLEDVVAAVRNIVEVCREGRSLPSPGASFWTAMTRGETVVEPQFADSLEDKTVC